MKPREFFQILALAALGFVSPVCAFAGRPSPEKVTCATLFEYLSKQLPRSGFTTNFVQTLQESQQTVSFLKSYSDNSGDEYWVFQKSPDAQWGSNFRTTGFDPQGDPRWFLELVGEDVAHVWGFYWDKANVVHVPSPKTWNKKLSLISDELEALGHERIVVGYHHNLHVNPTTNQTSVTKYLRHFVATGKIPMAGHGIPFLHDISFHTGAIVIEKRFLDIARGRVEYFLEASKYIDQQIAENKNLGFRESHTKVYHQLVKALRDEAVEMVDSGTGLINPLLSDANFDANVNGDAMHVTEIAFNVHSRLLGVYSMSSADNLRAKLIKTLREVNSYPGTRLGEEVLALVAEFDATFKSSVEVFDAHRPLDITAEELCVSMAQRRQVIREISTSLAGHKQVDGTRLLNLRTWLSRLFFKH